MINRLDVVVEAGEEVQEEVELVGKCAGYDQGELDAVLEEYGGMTDVPGSTDLVELEIETGIHTPIQQAPYSIPLGLREKVREELKNLEEQGIIERSSSSWASPLIPVKKSDGNIRLCVDLRRLNSITITELHP